MLIRGDKKQEEARYLFPHNKSSADLEETGRPNLVTRDSTNIFLEAAMACCEEPTPKAIRKSRSSRCVAPWRHEGRHRDERGIEWTTFHVKPPKPKLKYGKKKWAKGGGVPEAMVSKVWDVLEGKGD